MSTRWAIGCFCGLLGACCLLADESNAEIPYQADWAREFVGGESSNRSVDVDAAGNIFVSGFTTGDHAGPNAGGSDAYLLKYDAAGVLLWSRQLGTSANEASNGLAVDALGNVYTTGWTRGALGGPLHGELDVFLVKHSGAGDLVWSRQIGTATIEESWSVSVDVAGSVFVAGDTFGSLDGMNAGHNDAFVVKFDSDGNQQWARQFGTTGHDYGYDVATDMSGNVFVAGASDLGGASFPMGYLTKYDVAGNKLWQRFSTISGWNEATAVATDMDGNVLVAGRMPGADGFDTSLAKCDPDGNLLWLKSSGVSGADEPYGLATDALGNAYVTGAWGLYGFAAKFDPNGNSLWFGGLDDSETRRGFSIGLDDDGNLVVAGDRGPGIGTSAFLMKFAPIPEPTSVLLLAGGTMLTPLVRRRTSVSGGFRRPAPHDVCDNFGELFQRLTLLSDGSLGLADRWISHDQDVSDDGTKAATCKGNVSF